MKKITLLFMFLAVSLGYAQIDSNYCSTDVFHFDNPAEVNSAMKLTIENTGASTMKITAAAADITFLAIEGPPMAGNPTKSVGDASVSGEISIILTYPGAPPTDVVFPFIQWEKTSTGGARWQILNATTPFLGVCAPPPTPQEDITLSDLKLDGVTIAGFNSTKKIYNIGVTLGGSAPVVTSVTPTNTNAKVGAITQASGVPGSATFNVTSEDTTVNQTYTINFTFQGPPTPAQTPPARAAADVISVYSDAYADITIDDFDFGLCGASAAVREESISGNLIQHYLGAPCQGIDMQNNRVDASTFTNLHFDFFTDETNLIGKVFNLKLVDWKGNPTEAGSTALEINFNDGSGLVSGSWVSVDVNLTAIGGKVSGNLTRSDIAQIHITSNLANAWYDNLYLYKGTPLSSKDFEIAGLNVYPNPTQDSWTVKTQNIKMSSIQVFDILGKQVLSLAPNAIEAKIDASVLKSGLYFAKINTANGSSSVKLVRQ